jgi:hypothetical protein
MQTAITKKQATAVARRAAAMPVFRLGARVTTIVRAAARPEDKETPGTGTNLEGARPDCL